jgi:uncharacterized membrane protein
MKNILLYLITTVIFFAIDMVWLGFVAKDFYRKHIGGLLADNVNWLPAIIFYLLYIGGILFFAVHPAIKSGAWQTALLNGALLGMLCYATYDFTNMATLKNWSYTVVWVDIIWSIVLTGSVSTLSFFVARRFLNF